jgi:hypothetical protein
MNFSEFELSNFLKLGRTRYSFEDNDFKLMSICLYETTPILPLTQNEVSSIDWNKSPGVQHGCTLLPLRRAIFLRNFLKTEFKEEITKQWLEVNNALKLIDRHLPIESFLLIQSPGQLLPKHKHGGSSSPVKQTITFCYDFEQNRVNGKDCLEFYDNENNIISTINYPDGGKFCFDFVDSPWHQGYSSKWRFFWFHDYTDYKDISSIEDWNYLGNNNELS